MSAWIYDREMKEHFKHFDDESGVERYMAVYKTAAGDYAITCRQEGDPCGGDMDYEQTLPKAKAKAEALIESGHWLELAL